MSICFRCCFMIMPTLITNLLDLQTNNWLVLTLNRFKETKQAQIHQAGFNTFTTGFSTQMHRYSACNRNPIPKCLNYWSILLLSHGFRFILLYSDCHIVLQFDLKLVVHTAMTKDYVVICECEIHTMSKWISACTWLDTRFTLPAVYTFCERHLCAPALNMI